MGALRGWLGSRAQGPAVQDSESQRLMTGPDSSTGDLDSIFDRLNAEPESAPQVSGDCWVSRPLKISVWLAG